MPTPRKGESQKDFVKRAIPMLMKKEKRKQKQAIAIAFSMYKNKKKMKESITPDTFAEYFTEN